MKSRNLFVPLTHCPKCGKRIIFRAKACPKCGLRLDMIKW